NPPWSLSALVDRRAGPPPRHARPWVVRHRRAHAAGGGRPSGGAGGPFQGSAAAGATSPRKRSSDPIRSTLSEVDLLLSELTRRHGISPSLFHHGTGKGAPPARSSCSMASCA